MPRGRAGCSHDRRRPVLEPRSPASPGRRARIAHAATGHAPSHLHLFRRHPATPGSPERSSSTIRRDCGPRCPRLFVGGWHPGGCRATPRGRGWSSAPASGGPARTRGCRVGRGLFRVSTVDPARRGRRRRPGERRGSRPPVPAAECAARAASPAPRRRHRWGRAAARAERAHTPAMQSAVAGPRGAARPDRRPRLTSRGPRTPREVGRSAPDDFSSPPWSTLRRRIPGGAPSMSEQTMTEATHAHPRGAGRGADLRRPERRYRRRTGPADDRLPDGGGRVRHARRLLPRPHGRHLRPAGCRAQPAHRRRRDRRRPRSTPTTSRA